ncbi:glycoside hydrolase family 30 beta sandwich domain-containing protein, partial [Acetobacter oeni]
MTTITGVTPFDNVQKLAPGSIVQPIAVMTNVAETSELAPVAISASAPASDVPGSEIIIDPAHEYQDWIGVGGAFTEATAYVLMTYMTAANRAAFLQKMFGTDGFQCLRICFGSSDYSFRTYYSYDDNGGVADPDLTNFSIQRDQDYIIPLLQEILLINPRIWIFASVWSPPAWLKTSASLCGGWFNATAANYTTYANYLVMAIQAYEACGIPIAAVTPQNEPQGNHTDYPSCEWTGAQLVTFIGSYLGPALAAANLNTEIIACDTSWGSAPSYGLAVLGDTTGKQFCQSVGYHGYNGYVSEVPGQLRPYPGTRVYFTEWISTLSGQGDSLLFGAEKWCADLLNNMVRYGARALMLWNIALDQTGAPYEQSPSTAHECRGMVTINNSTGAITYNSEYLAFAHISKYVQRGAKRIQSNVFTMVASNSYSSTVSSVTGTDVTNVAFKNPDGSIVVFLWNPLSAARTVVLTDSYLGQSMPVTIPAQSYQTVTWGADNVITTAATFTAPGAPTLGTPTTNSAGQVVVPITAPASVGSSDLGGYRVFAGSAAGAEATMPLFTIPGTSTSFTDTLLASGSTRFYKAEAFGLGGASAASNEVSGTPVAASATTYTLTGSAALNVGTASTFTVTPNAALYAAATITPACTVAGTFSPTSVTLAEGSSAAATFTFTPSATGTGTLSTTNSAGLTDPAGLAVTVAAATTPFTTYTSALSASSVVMGNPVTLTITPGTGAANTSAITVTPASTLAGVFSPATVSIPAGSTAAVTCTFTPSASGTATISTTN